MLIRIFALILVVTAGLLPVGTLQAQPYGGGGDAVDCVSRGYSYQRCDVPWRDARLVRQLSDTQCVRGRSWGVDPRGFIWVDRGCGARFVAAGYGQGPGPGPGPGPWRPGPGWDNRFEITCGSPQYNYAFCQVDVGGGGRVSIRRQTSDARCAEGQSWGWNRAGVWVDKGCSAVFTVDRRWR
jgi:hypothetical protein